MDINREEYTALLDSGAEVSLIPIKVALNLDLLISENTSLYYNSVSGRGIRFLDICENIIISIRDIEYRTPI